MKNKESVRNAKFVLMIVLFAVLVLFSSINGFAQTDLSVISATKLIKQTEAFQAVNYENVTIAGDFDLSNLSERINDAAYPEKNKTARVFSAKVTQPIIFRNVVFDGKLVFFRKIETDDEIKEYRIVFGKAVVFENCTFNQTADFELTNFDGGVSFANSTFRGKPSFVRIGLETLPDLTKAIFENGSVFKNFQNDAPRDLTAMELEGVYRKYIESSK